ncbi:HDOD domain-containing protein [Ramlibacter sp. MMS24-I3-19]|uniref:HDOD domain-containing protein n=1 Tax=Ramlibacter sp. MMS24-I3-19 TaxID=3416606 RepID=UPI003D012A42
MPDLAPERVAPDPVSPAPDHQDDWGRYLVQLLAVRPSRGAEPPQSAHHVLAALDAALAPSAPCERLLRRAPGVVPRLVQALRSSDYARSEVVRLVEHDTLLTAELLRVTRSVLYAYRSVSKASIGHAVDLLGRVGLQQVVARALLRPLLSGDDGGLQLRAAPTIWEDTERCALLAASLAGGVGLDPGDTYLAALVHGMAWSGLLRAIELASAAPLLHGGLFDDPAFVERLRGHRAVLAQRLATPWGVSWLVDGPIEDRERWRNLVGVVDDMVCAQRLHADVPGSLSPAARETPAAPPSRPAVPAAAPAAGSPGRRAG